MSAFIRRPSVLFIPAFLRNTGRFPHRLGNVRGPHASGCIDGVRVVGDRGKNRRWALACVAPRLYRTESTQHLHSPGDTRFKCGGLLSYSLTLPTKLLSPDHSHTQVLKSTKKLIQISLSGNTRQHHLTDYSVLFVFCLSIVSVFRKTRFWTFSNFFTTAKKFWKKNQKISNLIRTDNLNSVFVWNCSFLQVQNYLFVLTLFRQRLRD